MILFETINLCQDKAGKRAALEKAGTDAGLSPQKAAQMAKEQMAELNGEARDSLAQASCWASLCIGIRSDLDVSNFGFRMQKTNVEDKLQKTHCGRHTESMNALTATVLQQTVLNGEA